MSGTYNHVIMLASENDALIGGKVGGVGDVMRDLPTALAARGWTTTVITPSYGFLHHRNPSRPLQNILFPFAGRMQEAAIHEVTGRHISDHIRYLVIDHPNLLGDPIYYNDSGDHVFARDATKYALFCSAAGQFLTSYAPEAIVHLHDWHAAHLFLLRHLHPAFQHLRERKCVFTIHNLSIQGSRPLRGSPATVEEWFPELFQQNSWIPEWRDPRFNNDVYTPMAAGIRHADRINTVSPSYADEILGPSDHRQGVFGGEGLEQLLREAKSGNRLFGILNGTAYPPDGRSRRLSWRRLVDLMLKEILLSGTEDEYHTALYDRIGRMKEHPPKCILTSVTRIVEQKVRLLLERNSRGMSALEGVIDLAGKIDGVYVIIGTGVHEYEEKLKEVCRAHERFFFINRYSGAISDALFANGTLFLMPSLFEPCGISQMNAMREGQPCVVHAVGGLRDTVADGVNGFHFSGGTLEEKVDNFVRVTGEALRVCYDTPDRWKKICQNAARQRFTWDSSADLYVRDLYSA